MANFKESDDAFDFFLLAGNTAQDEDNIIFCGNFSLADTKSRYLALIVKMM